MKKKTVLLNYQDLEFPEYIRFLRRIHELTLIDVCESVGISQTKLMFLENGAFKYVNLTPDQFQSLGECLGVDAKVLEDKQIAYINAGKGRHKYIPKYKRVA